jgi:hypothetical protein
MDKGPMAEARAHHSRDEDEEKDDAFFIFPSNGTPVERK